MGAKDNENHQIGDIISFSGSAGVRCTRDTIVDENKGTIPPVRASISYSGSDLKEVSVSDSDEMSARTYVDLNGNGSCVKIESSSKYSCKDVVFTIKGEASSTLYTLDSDGNLDKKLGVLDANGEFSYTHSKSNSSYGYYEGTKKTYYYDQVDDFVTVDDANNISKINRIFIRFFPIN